MTIWNSKLWFAWPGTDNPHHIYVGYFDLNAGWGPVTKTADFTCAICDLTLVLQGGTLRIPYAGASLGNNINVDSSTDGKNWSNDQGEAGSLWGAGGAVDGGNHFWITFPNWNSPSSSNLQIVIYQYN